MCGLWFFWEIHSWISCICSWLVLDHLVDPKMLVGEWIRIRISLGTPALSCQGPESKTKCWSFQKRCTHELSNTSLEVWTVLMKENETVWKVGLFGTCPILYQLLPFSFSPSLVGVTRPTRSGRGKIPQPLSCLPPKTEQTQNKQSKSLDESLSIGLYLTADGQGRHHPYSLFPSLLLSLLSSLLFPYQGIQHTTPKLWHKLELKV